MEREGEEGEGRRVGEMVGRGRGGERGGEWVYAE